MACAGIHLPAGGDHQVNGVQLQRAGLGNEICRRVLGKRSAGKHVARELEGHGTDSWRVVSRAYDQFGKGRTGMSKTYVWRKACTGVNAPSRRL